MRPSPMTLPRLKQSRQKNKNRSQARGGNPAGFFMEK